MSGRAYQPRFLWMWPNSRISVMGGRQAASVLSTVHRDNLARKGQEFTAEQEAEFSAPTLAQYESQGSPWYSTARLWDDGVIAPEDTRRILSQALDVITRPSLPETSFGLFRM